MNNIDFSTLANLSTEELLDLGLRKWSGKTDKNNKILWLFPGNLYESIPEDTEITFIDNTTEKFKINVTESDTRFGMLAFGVML